MNLVFIGSSNFDLRCLQNCLGLPGGNVAGVVTAPWTFAISYRPGRVTNVLHADVAALGEARHIPVRTLERSMTEPRLFEAVSAWNCAPFWCPGGITWYPVAACGLAPAYGLHASLLPDYSGGAPLGWAMINGETKTGITLFQMVDGVDCCPIAGQREEPILQNDTIATLYARIEDRGLELLRDALPMVACGTIKTRPQDEAKRRIMLQPSPEGGRIDWTNDAASIDRPIRAQTRPYPRAFSILVGKPLTTWRSRPVAGSGDRKMGLVEKTADRAYRVTRS